MNFVGFRPLPAKRLEIVVGAPAALFGPDMRTVGRLPPIAVLSKVFFIKISVGVRVAVTAMLKPVILSAVMIARIPWLPTIPAEGGEFLVNF
jgi:hypothetical protein